MTVLSAQTIQRLCFQHPPLLDPFEERGSVNGMTYGLGPCSYDVRSAGNVLVPVGQFRLAVTMERFRLPDDICAQVLDKSTWARRGLSAFNTHLDPGWEGFLTVELINGGTEVVSIRAGDPLVQIRFDWLDQPTDRPYRGKYQDQPQRPVSAILE